MTDLRPPTPEELSAYHDGQLDPDRLVEVAQFLAENTTHDELMATDAAIRDGLKALHQPVSGDIPKILRAALDEQYPPPWFRRHAIALIAGTALLGLAAVLLT
ncbi:anti-sigma factor family protein [Parvularcula lutaonensis]|uniref:Anti-sigma factor family protein n=1 Tax=Parvularcula lutaonensis TaxID=491923 RepID=A0ABV7MAM8_9PROT|nr:hypothetical protein [Parvularcula lutaonensis]GGY38403.1 hypothetical protein GCM10007148_03390 [Parvularcula lutaonensis]